MRTILKILAWICIAVALIGLPVGMFEVMDKSGYLDTGSTGETLLVTPDQEAAAFDQATLSPDVLNDFTVTVTTSTLEKRSKAGGGENVGYWLEGEQITVAWSCMSDTGNIWIAFAGGWSAARFEGRQFVSPLPVVVEVCDE